MEYMKDADMATAAPKSPGVQQELGLLKEAVGRVENQTCELQARLGDVLRIMPEQSDTQCELKENPVLVSAPPLVVAMFETRVRLESLSDKLGSIMRRLEV